MDEVSSHVQRGGKECTPIKRSALPTTVKRKFIFDFRGHLEGLNKDLFKTNEQEERDVPGGMDSGMNSVRKELRDDCIRDKYPEVLSIPRQVKDVDYGGDTSEKPSMTSILASEVLLQAESGTFLPTCPLFLKYLRTKGIRGKCIFQGWVAFFLGDKITQLKASKKLRRSDLRYVLIVSESKPILYAFQSPDLPDATSDVDGGPNNDETAKNDTVIINLAKGISIESWFITKRKGHCIVIRDARYDKILCSLLPTNLPPRLFIDSIYSRIVDNEIYKHMQDIMLSPLAGVVARDEKRIRRRHSLESGNAPGNEKRLVWGDPEYLLKFAPVAQLEAATYLLFSVSAIIRRKKLRE
eukprot:CAMPEP_0172516868 /NCGR_PEP_ID=MMETSP1066-20121228/279736_1 /TAXON_ID=671091 /ORGANISM="Coscinodiscus wailesii, Strain CCMP2513" /LENGTH=353 /DNA_ID=CAMNT_0013298547 /DNA_START=296 /DNA_END=1357 /DNA_ORIENTATION=-